MRCYYHELFRDIRFDKSGYQQFLREQGLSEHDIKRLNIHFILSFTSSHLRGSVELAAGGAFFQRSREYVERENLYTLGFYRPFDPPSDYAAIFLRPARYETPAHLNRTFLHETRHHIQHCLKLPCCSTVNAGVENEAHSAGNQPWEIDADRFAKTYVNQVAFLSQPSERRLKRSDLRYLR